MVFVCENNGYGEFTPMQTVTSVRDIAQRAQAYNIPGFIVDGNDVIEVFRFASEAVARARAGEGPTLLECKTYRWEGHVVGEAAFLGEGAYRPTEEVEAWKLKCPIIRYQQFLVSGGKIDKTELDRIDSETTAELDDAIKFARESDVARCIGSNRRRLCEVGKKGRFTTETRSHKVGIEETSNFTSGGNRLSENFSVSVCLCG